ncbi:DUF6538 domain-containing protein [Rhodanobacter sp. DHG33]|uniref:DUF6538 domain-containing protein n=1 Tax=Rhodanobacter sp. DHG33 TaxID=2775921 RepID=UPI0017873D37|nr:DUF6538 domain-containing protein [Rhodanobacter sp. DHG33]MBD8899149.1 tyrosine-type recombinase/integrase [Rhodanobacter sp. DHG33]
MFAPHYLTRRASGYTFQMKVPTALRAPGGKHLIRVTLGTDRRHAQRLALALADTFAATFRWVRCGGGKMGKEDEARALAAGLAAAAGKEWTITPTPHGPQFATEPHDTPDAIQQGVAEYREARADWKEIERLRVQLDAEATATARARDDERMGAVAAEMAAFRASLDTRAAPVPGHLLGAAVDQWLAAEDKRMKAANRRPTSFETKAKAIRDFVAAMTPARRLDSIEPQDLGAYATQLLNDWKPGTAHDKMSYIGHFFAWAMKMRWYPPGENPTEGWTKRGRAEREASAARGAQAFEDDELRRIFEPADFARLDALNRWQTLLMLYTGGRSDDIANILLKDAHNDAGAGGWWVEIRGGKTDATARKIPIHDELVTIGFGTWVEARRAEKSDYLFPGLPRDTKKGAAGRVQKDLSKYLKSVEVFSPPGTEGVTHRFRDTVITAHEVAGVDQAMSERYTGHAVSGKSVLAVPRVMNYVAKDERRGALLAQISNLRVICLPPISWGAHGVVNVENLAAIMQDTTAPKVRRRGQYKERRQSDPAADAEHARRAVERKAIRDARAAGLPRPVEKKT